MCSHSTKKYLIASVKKLDVCLYAPETDKDGKRDLDYSEDTYKQNCNVE